MTEQAATIPGDRRFQRMAQQALAVWRRLPFTTTVVVAMLIVGLATGALWRQAMDQPWYPDVAFGLPSFVDGPVVDARHGRVLRAHAVVLPADGGELRVVRRVGRVPPRHPTHGRGDGRRAGARGGRGGPLPPRRAESGLAVGGADRDAARRRVLGGRVGGRRGDLGDAAATLAVARTARARDLRPGCGVLHGHTGRSGALPRRRHRAGGRARGSPAGSTHPRWGDRAGGSGASSPSPGC